MQDGHSLGGTSTLALRALVLFLEPDFIDLLMRKEGGIPRIVLDFDLPEHLPDDDLDVLVVRPHPLQAVDLLDLVEQIFAQLATYTEEAFQLYHVFTAIDFFFPLFAGLFLGATVAFLLRHSLPRWYSIAEEKNLFVLFLLATLFDLLENISLLGVLAGYPNELSTIATLAVAAKMGKLGFVFLFQGLSLLLLIFCAGQWLARKAGLIKD